MSVISSLTNRIFFAGAALVGLSIGVAIFRVNVAVTAQAEVELRNGLAEAASLVDEFSRTRFDGFAREAALIADLPDLKAAVRTGDAPTVEPIAREYQGEIKADVFIVLDRSDRILARAGRVLPDQAPLAAMLSARPALQSSRWLMAYDGGVLQIAAIPMEPGLAPIGALIVGLALDQDAVDRIRAVSDSDIVLSTPTRIVASTLPIDRAQGLESYVQRHDVFDVALGGDSYVARVQALDPQAAADAPVAIVLRSRTSRLAILSTLRRDILGTGLIAILLATVAGYLVARTVTRPLRAITATMTEMANTGDIGRAVPESGKWDDEDARTLAATFRQMTTALRLFQRDSAQRERLSALGRLSTVVAHEVRNPLMIIKTVLRNLRRAQTLDAVGASVDSIDEEITRLNRVVSDVLDFARPISFEWTQADLIQIARDAAEAVRATSPEGEVTVSTTAPVAPVVTDPERLRAVLVNVLTNAQQAVAAQTAPPGTSPSVTIAVSRLPGDRWLIAVTDTGIGISAADLSRIFEPFFTTRRTGSGLGLAIARNIVDGLGGSISIQSRPGAGSTVRIELPERPTVSR